MILTMHPFMLLFIQHHHHTYTYIHWTELLELTMILQVLTLSVWLAEHYHIFGIKKKAILHLLQKGIIPVNSYYKMSYHLIVDVINVLLLMKMAKVILILPCLLLKVLFTYKRYFYKNMYIQQFFRQR